MNASTPSHRLWMALSVLLSTASGAVACGTESASAIGPGTSTPGGDASSLDDSSPADQASADQASPSDSGHAGDGSGGGPGDASDASDTGASTDALDAGEAGLRPGSLGAVSFGGASVSAIARTRGASEFGADSGVYQPATIFLAGQANPALTDFGNGPLVCPPAWDAGWSNDVFVTGNPGGSKAWAACLSGSMDLPASLAADQAGNVGLAGVIGQGGRVDFGKGPTFVVNTSPVVAEYAQPDGTLLWSKVFEVSGNNSTTWAAEVAPVPSGGLYVVTSIGGVVDLGGGPMSSRDSYDAGTYYTDDAELFAARFAPDGSLVWSKRLTSSAGLGGTLFALSLQPIVASDDGGFVVLGTFFGPVDFGDGKPITSTGDQGSLYVARYDTSGDLVWRRTFGSNAGGQDQPAGLDIDSDGSVLVSGLLTSTGGATPWSADFGGGAVAAPGAFLAKYAAADGSYVWADVWSQSSAAMPYSGPVSVTLGAAFLSGYFSGSSLDVGCGPMTAVGGAAAFVERLDANGHCVWSLPVQSAPIGGVPTPFPTSSSLGSGLLVAFDKWRGYAHWADGVDDGNLAMAATFTGSWQVASTNVLTGGGVMLGTLQPVGVH